MSERGVREFARLLARRVDRGDALSAAAGIAWGLLGVVLMEHSRQGIVAALFAWPTIGFVIGRLARPAAVRGPLARACVSLGTIYLAVAMFATAEWAAASPGPVPGSSVLSLSSTILLMLVGVTFWGYVAVLWPLSYITHSAVWSAVSRDSARLPNASPGCGA